MKASIENTASNTGKRRRTVYVTALLGGAMVVALAAVFILQNASKPSNPAAVTGSGDASNTGPAAAQAGGSTSQATSPAGGGQEISFDQHVRNLNDPTVSTRLRCEAAFALADLNQPWVLDPLSRAARDDGNTEVAEAALAAIAKLTFSDMKPFFQDYLQSKDFPSELRVAAVEALAGLEGDSTRSLAELAARDPDPDVRAAAASELGAAAETGNLGAAVLAMLQSEADPDVRLRLYQALRNQSSFDVDAALALVQNEQDPAARVAGLDLLAKTLRDNPNPAVQNFFDQYAVPELKELVKHAVSLDEQQAAVIALTRARTPAAQAALAELSKYLEDMRRATAGRQQARNQPGTSNPKPRAGKHSPTSN